MHDNKIHKIDDHKGYFILSIVRGHIIIYPHNLKVFIFTGSNWKLET